MAFANRKLWLAALLGLVMPGLGHLYSGWPVRGALIYVSLALLPVLYVLIALLSLTSPWLGKFIGLWILCLPLLYLAQLLDAARLARDRGTGYQLRGYNTWYVYLGIVVLLLACLFVGADALRAFVVQAYKIPAASMAPTLLVGDYIFVNKLAYRFDEPAWGDVVVFKYPKDERKESIKRIVGMPGDTIRIRNKLLFLNGKAIDDADYTERLDPIVLSDSAHLRDHFGPVTVPANSYFVLGDSRDQSLDSRFWGYVSRSKITGKAARIYWSYDGSDGSPRWDRLGKAIQD